MLRLLLSKGGWPLQRRSQLEACTCTPKCGNFTFQVRNYLAQCTGAMLRGISRDGFKSTDYRGAATIAGDRWRTRSRAAQGWEERIGDKGGRLSSKATTDKAQADRQLLRISNAA